MAAVTVAGAAAVIAASTATPSSSRPAAGAFPASPEIAFSHTGSIQLMRPDGSGVAALTTPTGEAEDSQPAWSPDGSRLAFVRSVERGDLASRSQLILLDASGERPFTELSKNVAYAPAWSPDGRRIAFARWRGEEDRYSSEIVLASLDGGQERVLRRIRLDRRLSAVGEPAWSPDGARIAYTRTALDRSYHFRSSLYVIGAGGGAPELLASDAGGAAWSPDGSRIAFSSTRDRNGDWCGSDECVYTGELYVMDSDGSNPLRLTHSRGDDRSPSWSPDGRRIVFASNRNNRDDPPGEDMEIYTIGADGSCLTWLTNGAPQSAYPAWRPPRRTRSRRRHAARLRDRRGWRSNRRECGRAALIPQSGWASAMATCC
jgi:TolB protein